MIGYGVTNTQTNSNTSSGFNISPISNSDHSSKSINQPKKELTLVEKQQLANKLEKENGSLKSSKSMTDNFLNKNLADLSFNSSQKAITAAPNNNFDFFSEFDNNSSVNKVEPSQLQKNNLFNVENSTFNNNMNGSNQFKSPQFNNNFNNNNNNNNISSMTRSNTSQQGFFGNLALPAPSSFTDTVSNKNTFSVIPNIAPPPMKPLQPMINLTAKPATTNISNGTKKSAFDDLNDLFG